MSQPAGNSLPPSWRSPACGGAVEEEFEAVLFLGVGKFVGRGILCRGRTRQGTDGQRVMKREVVVWVFMAKGDAPCEGQKKEPAEDRAAAGSNRSGRLPVWL